MERTIKIVLWVTFLLIVLMIAALVFYVQPIFRRFGDFLNSYGAAITALATLIIAIFTIVLASTTRRQARLTREAMIANKRAFVFAVDLRPFYELDKETNLCSWRFRPVLRNSGDTPTKNMVSHTGYALRDAPLPNGFNFNYPTNKTAKGLIAPDFAVLGSQAPDPPDPAITTQDILDIQAGCKYLYLWGWIRYYDVFPNTNQHVSRFCWLITPDGRPKSFHSGGPDLKFGYVHHQEGNCADEECARYEDKSSM